jgi:hypothetical protein
MGAPIELSTRRELFVDHFLIEELDGLALQLQRPQPREVVFRIQGPGENACTACYNLHQDGPRVVMYYRGYYPLGEDYADHRDSQTTNLAVSDDGVHFQRPALGLEEFGGSRENNIVLQGQASHNFCVFLDGNPAASAEARYKAVGGGQRDSLRGFYSANGVHWHPLQDEPLAVVGAFDSLNVPLWDPHAGCYRLYSRYFEEVEGVRVRAIQSCTSDDFVHWSDPVPHHYADGVPLEQFYTNATAPCPGAEHILLSTPMRFLPARVRCTDGMDYPGQGLSDAVFMSSRDGVHWDRSFTQAWVRPGQDQRNWSHRSMTAVPGIIQTRPDEWSVYLGEHYGWSDNCLRRYAVRPHGFAALAAGRPGGRMLTRPLLLPGGTLRLNYATSAAGCLRVALCGESGQALEGFGMDDMEPVFGDELDAAVGWRGGGLGAVGGSPLRLRFELEDADLFSLRVEV